MALCGHSTLSAPLLLFRPHACAGEIWSLPSAAPYLNFKCYTDISQQGRRVCRTDAAVLTRALVQSFPSAEQSIIYPSFAAAATSTKIAAREAGGTRNRRQAPLCINRPNRTEQLRGGEGGLLAV